MEAFFHGGGKPVLLEIIIKQLLYNRNGLALAMTCKLLYGLLTPTMRLQMRAGLFESGDIPVLVLDPSFRFPAKPQVVKQPGKGKWFGCKYCSAPIKCCNNECLTADTCKKMKAHVTLRCGAFLRDGVREACRTCHRHPSAHPTCIGRRTYRHECPFRPVICASGSCKSTVQMIFPWSCRTQLVGVQCNHCGCMIRDPDMVLPESCTNCGIFCRDCRVRTCNVCFAKFRGSSRHQCAAYIDRLEHYARAICSRYAGRHIATLERDETNVVIHGTMSDGLAFRWIMVPGPNKIPPTPLNRGEMTSLVALNYMGDFEIAIYYHDTDRELGKFHFKDYRSRLVAMYPICFYCLCTIEEQPLYAKNNHQTTFCSKVCKKKSKAK